MKASRVVPFLTIGLTFMINGLVATGEPPTARDTPQGELQNAVARVIYPNEVSDPSIQARLEPGPFTIPKGYVATRLKYNFADPKTGLEHGKLTATTIYSITEGRYIKEAKNNPEIILPAGEYKVVCGGLPDATGVLTYRLIREDLVSKSTVEDVAVVQGERFIEVETWLATPKSEYNPRQRAVYRIRGSEVQGTIDQLLEPPKYGDGVTCDPMPIKGKFKGSIAGNVIIGKWDVKVGAHKMHFSAIPGTTYPNHDRTDSSSHSYETRLVLNADGTLHESIKGSGVSESVWGPTAPKSIANERNQTNYDFEVPGKDSPEPMQGTWKERKQSP